MSALVISFDERCRLCIDNAGAIGIFETEDLHRDIFACTSVKISPSDNLPQKICPTCSEIVKNAAKLREVAIKADETLRIFAKDACHGSDDDSRDTVCLEPLQNNIEPETAYSPEKLVITGNNEHNDSIKERKLKIRKDLFGTPSPSKNNNFKVVKSKEDYDEAKIIMKENPNCEILYKCGKCAKKFKTWKKLYHHLRNHDKKYCCPIDVCGKTFATKGDLEKHVRTHTGVRPYACEICDKSFTQQGALKAHKEKVHFCIQVP